MVHRLFPVLLLRDEEEVIVFGTIFYFFHRTYRGRPWVPTTREDVHTGIVEINDEGILEGADVK